MHNASEPVSISKLHEITGYAREVITKKLRDNNVPFEKTGRGHMFDKTMALAVLYNNPNAVTEDDAKKRKAIAEAEKAEIAVAKLKGELVSADEMRKAAAELVKTMYQRIVRVEPAVIAGRCVGLDAIGIETQIRDAMSMIFDEVRTNLSAFMTIDEVEDNDGSVPDNG